MMAAQRTAPWRRHAIRGVNRCSRPGPTAAVRNRNGDNVCDVRCEGAQMCARNARERNCCPTKRSDTVRPWRERQRGPAATPCEPRRAGPPTQASFAGCGGTHPRHRPRCHLLLRGERMEGSEEGSSVPRRQAGTPPQCTPAQEAITSCPPQTLHTTMAVQKTTCASRRVRARGRGARGAQRASQLAPTCVWSPPHTSAARPCAAVTRAALRR